MTQHLALYRRKSDGMYEFRMKNFNLRFTLPSLENARRLATEALLDHMAELEETKMPCDRRENVDDAAEQGYEPLFVTLP